MSRKETADSRKLLKLLGKPTPDTRYNATNNPAVIKLLDTYDMDTDKVCRWYDVLVSLGWVQEDYEQFVRSVEKTKKKRVADERTASRIMKQKAAKSPARKPEFDDDLVSKAAAAVDDGMLISIQKELNAARRTIKDMQATDYEKRKMISELRSALEECTPDKFTIKFEKVSPSHGKGKFYNILPLSDIHWGEVVKSNEVNGLNEYNFEISKQRHIELFRKNYEYAQAFGCDELDIFMLGDMFSGNIHDELRENNEAPITKCIAQYYKFITGLIDAYKGCYRKVRIHCVVGNHARTTQKYQFKSKGIENYEYILYSFIESKYNDSNDNVTVIFGDSTVLFTKVGNQTWKLEHGDRYKGGSAFVSPLSTTVRDNFKDQAIFAAIGQKFDAVMMGHWHIGGIWYLPGTTTPVYLNPSLIGPGEYSVHNLHSAFPASSFSFITDGNKVVDQRLIDLSGIR